MESSHEDEDDSNGDNEDESNESAPPRAPKRARPIRAAASETGTGSLARTSQSHSEPPSRAPGPSGGGSRRSGLRGEQEEEQEGGDLVQFRRDLGCEDGLLEFSVSLKQMTDAEIMDLVWRAKEGLAEATMADVLADVFDVLNRRDGVEKVVKNPYLYDILASPSSLPYRGKAIGVYASALSPELGSAPRNAEKNLTASLILCEDVYNDTVMFIKTVDSDDQPTSTARFTSEDVMCMLRFTKKQWVDVLCGTFCERIGATCRTCGKRYALFPDEPNVCRIGAVVRREEVLPL
eukprot:jgi/Mesvir1/7767/Mv11710-RA.1